MIRRSLWLMLPIGCLLGAFQSSSGEFDQFIKAEVARFYQVTAPEKAYLHLDKDSYTAGETIWFTGYLVSAGQHRTSNVLSQVLYVDMLNADGQVLAHQTLPIKQGTAPGDFLLPTTLAQGEYTIRAYTNWMRNTPDYLFARQIMVWSSNTVPVADAKDALAAVQFFPEGGELVNGLSGVVAFKAVDATGRGVDVSGTVQDETGRAVAEFSSMHLGMGQFEFQPVAGHQYKALVRQGSGPVVTYALPSAQPTGLAMRVREVGEQYEVLVQRHAAEGEPKMERVTLAGHVRGQAMQLQQAELEKSTVFRLPKKAFPAGIAHLTIFDGAQRPRCERLVFSRPDSGLQLKAQADKTSYQPYEKATVQLVVRDAAGQPVAGQFSLAVTNATLVPLPAGAADIRTSLLLTSDLAGAVEQPGYYFTEPSATTNRALDNLLLTQGWRRFTWPQVLAGKVPEFAYKPEDGLRLSGRVIDQRQQPAANARLLLTRAGAVVQEQLTTDDEGRFSIGGFTNLDSGRVKLQVELTKKLKQASILFDAREPAATPLAAALLPFAPGSATRTARLAAVQPFTPKNPNGQNIVLDNVTVQGRRVVERKPDMRRLYNRADATVDTRNIVGISTYRNILELLQGRVPGVSVVVSQGVAEVRMRGGTSSMAGLSLNTRRTEASNPASKLPLLLLDGIATDVTILSSLPINDLERIDVLKPGSASIYGERGGSGVVAFLTKYGNPNYDPNAPVVEPDTYASPRFYQAREFYQPLAASTAALASPSEKPLSTVYWNPSIRTDATGLATVSFYCANTNGLLRLNVEGLSDSGLPGVYTATLQVATKQ